MEKGPGAEEVEGCEKRLDVPRAGEEVSRDAKGRCERLRGGRDSTYSLKLREARLVEGSALLVLGSGESRPSRGGGPSSLPFGGRVV